MEKGRGRRESRHGETLRRGGRGGWEEVPMSSLLMGRDDGRVCLGRLLAGLERGRGINGPLTNVLGGSVGVGKCDRFFSHY